MQQNIESQRTWVKCVIAKSDELHANATAQALRPTKKDRLIALVRSDPFLTVEEIAAAVGTTPRYVRTSLSEVGLSLTALRRQHAHTMNGRQNIHIRIPQVVGSDAPLTGLVVEAGVDVKTLSVRVAQTVDPEAALMLRAPATAPLLEVCRVRGTARRPLFISRVVTTRHLLVSDAIFTSDKPLVELLGLLGGEGVAFAERTFDVIRGNEYLCKSLQIAADAPIIRCGNVLTVAGEPVALKLHYFDGTRVRIALDYVSDNPIRIIARNSGE